MAKTVRQCQISCPTLGPNWVWQGEWPQPVAGSVEKFTTTTSSSSRLLPTTWTMVELAQDTKWNNSATTCTRRRALCRSSTSPEACQTWTWRTTSSRSTCCDWGHSPHGSFSKPVTYGWTTANGGCCCCWDYIIDETYFGWDVFEPYTWLLRGRAAGISTFEVIEVVFIRKTACAHYDRQ